MTDAENILEVVTNFFLKSTEKASYNGIAFHSICNSFENLPRELIVQCLCDLVAQRKIDCVFDEVNPHIKRYHDLPKNRQIQILKEGEQKNFCVYPTSSVVRSKFDVAKWDHRPFSQLLLLAEPQISFRSFDMGVLERYTGDPRYAVQFNDYMGNMSIISEFYDSENVSDRDKVSVQYFGLGFDERRYPYLVVYLRYLDDLTPEHQQYWASFAVEHEVRMTRQYYQSSMLGEFWKNRSVRYAIESEIKAINLITRAIYQKDVFDEQYIEKIPIGLSAFLRPTSENFQRFVQALDKLLSESIMRKFFKGLVPLDTEKERSDGKIEVQRKGTLTLLEEWMLGSLSWPDPGEFKRVIIAPLRNVRRLRQKPAHTFVEDNYSEEYYGKRKQILWDVLNSLSNIRASLATHPLASDIPQPEWINNEKIDVF